ncbi:meiosis-specific protein ASY2-like [Brassica napus]|uniref:meiosis-specific protein ASY2-like n=1 Tax=Brassica napus TaxID=3708 RepID=UPI00207ADE88|nr:meiosis-specific protein ASY2-like [Brassica napus]
MCKKESARRYALMVMAAEIDVSLSVRVFEELTSISSLDKGLLSIKMRPSYNVIGGHPNKTFDWQRSYFYVKSDSSAFEDPPDDDYQDWNSSYLPAVNTVKRRISLFTKEEQKRINEARRMKGLSDLSVMMAAQLVEPSGAPDEVAATDIIEATIQRQAPSPDASATASKKKKKKEKKQSSNRQSLPGKNAASRGTEVTGSAAQAGSTVEPSPNLALIDEPGDASPVVQLQKKERRTSEQVTTSRQVLSAAVPSVARDSASSIPRASTPITSAGGAPAVRTTPRVEFPDHISFEYDGLTPLIYAPNRCVELVSQIKCGPKPLPPVADLIFKDEYVDAARTKLLCDGVSNFVIEKYDTALKEALSESEKLKRTVAAKSRLFRRKRAEW